MNVEDKAKEMLKRSRLCGKCQLLKSCFPDMAKACADAFVDGYKKGWREHTYQAKRRIRDEYFEGHADK